MLRMRVVASWLDSLSSAASGARESKDPSPPPPIRFRNLMRFSIVGITGEVITGRGDNEDGENPRGFTRYQRQDAGT